MSNTVGKIIRFIGLAIIALGALAGIIVWIAVAHETDGLIGFASGAGTFIGSFISGILFVGFSEVIFLLQINLDSTRKNQKQENEYEEELAPKPAPQQIQPEPVKAMQNIDMKKIIEEKATVGENQIQCPHCGHIQNKSITRCLSCSKVIKE